MKLFLSLSFVLMFYACGQSQTYVKVQGIAQKGGQSIYTSGQPSTTKSVKTYPFCTVAVYLHGTSTLATIYSNDSGSAKTNPFTADGNAYWWFYAVAGQYDIRYTGTMVGDSINITDVVVVTGFQAGVSSFNGRTGAVVPAVNDYTFSQIGNVAQNRILGRGASSGTGVIQEITLGSGLSLSGTTLNATGSGGTVTGTGTTNRLTRWTNGAGGVLGDSGIGDDGSTLSLFRATLGSTIGMTNQYSFFNGTNWVSAGDGQIRFANGAGTGFTRMIFGDTTGARLEPSASGFSFGVNASGNAVLTGGQFVAGPSSGPSGQEGFKLQAALGSVNIKVDGAIATDWSLTLPNDDGTASGQALTTNGSGVTSWTTVTSSGSGSLNYAQALANTCETLTLTLTGAVSGDVITLGVPHALANHNTTATFFGWASAGDTVSVRRCVVDADGSDPAAATVNARKIH